MSRGVWKQRLVVGTDSNKAWDQLDRKGSGFSNGQLQFLADLVVKADELIFAVVTALRPGQLWPVWRRFRGTVVAPLLRGAIALCLVLLVMQMVEKLFMGAVSAYVKLRRRKPEKMYKYEPIVGDEETGNGVYPMVLVQIPMFNEGEVYQLSIDAVCQLTWPRERIIVQVLDDSTDHKIRASVRAECEKWAAKGMTIDYVVRDNRRGYKAGALQEGMMFSYVRDCEFIAMFDADFQPEPDFLLQTVPFLIHNPEVALVQSRWKFVNTDECLMTRIQEMSLNYHFKVEQEGGSSTFSFFGYNGTAGVWRASAIIDAGGWNDRTTVEDMDLSIRACLRGWKFVYVGDVKVKSELPSSFKAYRYQQHRWSCGPANLFRKIVAEVITCKKVSLWKKFYIICSFFIMGKIMVHMLTFIFFCVVIPLSVFVPEASIPQWGIIYVPLVITFCKAAETPRSFHLVVFWVLFENAMSLHRLKAAFTGLLEARRANEWIVTEKLGDSNRATRPSAESSCCDQNGSAEKATPPSVLQQRKKDTARFFWKRFRLVEMALGVLLLLCGVYDFLVSQKSYFAYIILQGIAFLAIGFDSIGTSTSINRALS